MVSYQNSGEYYEIHDYQNAKKFSSFLPSVSGMDGKPLWSFYCNVGQGMTSFGTNSKDTPMVPFQSVPLIYGTNRTMGFRTFIRINQGKAVKPFFEKKANQTLRISRSDFSVLEENDDFTIQATYFTVPHENYAALIRKVSITNHAEEEKEFEILDGLPVFLPYGISTWTYWNQPFLGCAYAEIKNLSEKAPYVKLKTSTGDNSQVSEAPQGHGFFAVDEEGKRLDTIVDPYCIFEDASFLESHTFDDLDDVSFLAQEQRTENYFPSAFAFRKTKIASKGTFTFYEVFGQWNCLEDFRKIYEPFTAGKAEGYFLESKKLIEELVAPAFSKTSYPLFDEFFKQSYLDNYLRGGFPTLLDDTKDGQVYYVYGRKHGDMERDYNAFVIPGNYYSGGPGNFRDVNQNRRMNLYFAPFVKDYDIQTFFNLIQVDGQNPLTVKPESFTMDKAQAKKVIGSLLSKEQFDRILTIADKFVPSDLYRMLRDGFGFSREKADRYFSLCLSVSHQNIEAQFSEGYWVDHWTYNVDLLESYSSIYPDQEEQLFFGKKDYGYFYSPVYVNPRSKKTVLLPDGKIRQYGTIDLNALKQKCEREHIDITSSDWLKDEEGNKIKVSLAAKVINLALIKFSCLDSQQMGVEMECEKPGWNDAMNGLPGLFASGLSETTELLRLVRYVLNHMSPFADHTIELLPKQKELLDGLEKNLILLDSGKISRFDYWDCVTTLRENLRAAYQDRGEKVVSVELSRIIHLFSMMEKVLEDGILRAKKVGEGILPSYLIYRVSSYEKTGELSPLGYPLVRVKAFELETIPPFLEASARALKLENTPIHLEDVEKIRHSDLYDQKLHVYKTCGDIDDAPFEIGRVHAFSKGWLERECCFLHMDYKFLLGLLEAGYYDEFYQEIKTNWTINMDPSVYGRNPIEASSFVVPTCNPDKTMFGQGVEARLTGANAEMLNMAILLFVGKQVFSYENGELFFHLDPTLSKEFFSEEGECSFLLFGRTMVTYENPNHIHAYEKKRMTYFVDGKSYDVIQGKLAEDIRDGKIKTMKVRIE